MKAAEDDLKRPEKADDHEELQEDIKTYTDKVLELRKK